MFLLKKIIAPFFMPLSVCLVLALLGLIFLWFTRRQKTGKVLVTISILMLGFFSYDAVSDMLARPLEQKYPPISDFQAVKDVKWIVVLSGGRRTGHRGPRSEDGGQKARDLCQAVFEVLNKESSKICLRE